jgi:hypothetical protein
LIAITVELGVCACTYVTSMNSNSQKNENLTMRIDMFASIRTCYRYFAEILGNSFRFD